MMEEFTSLDPEVQEPEVQEPETESLIEIPYQWEQQTDPEEVNLFLSDQAADQVQTSDQSQTELMTEVAEIKDLLREYLAEETTEETTDYQKLIYNETKMQNESLTSLQSQVITIGKDQQTIGVLTVGATVLLIGALGVFFFLWRLR